MIPCGMRNAFIQIPSRCFAAIRWKHKPNMKTNICVHGETKHPPLPTGKYEDNVELSKFVCLFYKLITRFKQKCWENQKIG